MTAIINTKLGVKGEKKRLWLEGQKLLREGVSPGSGFDVEIREHKLLIRVSDSGQYTVSRRVRHGKIFPVIDLVSELLTQLFEGVKLLRVCVRNGLIVVSAHQQEDLVYQRVAALKNKIVNGDSLDVCSLFHGGGILDKAFHSGLSMAGIQSHIEIAVEIESAYLEASLRNNPELWKTSSHVINSALEKVVLNTRIRKHVDLACLGIPCTGASLAGRAKNGLQFAESHANAGAMFFYALMMLQHLNPAIILFENVQEYANTASMEVIRSVLANLGYTLQERIIDGNEFGALEKRKRLCAVAISEGIDSGFDLNTILPLRVKENCLNDILENIPLDADNWKPYSYLAEKEQRDLSVGKGFARQLLSGSEAYCGSLGRGYYKARSTEPFFLHPDNSALSRLFTPKEHARVKAIPESVIEGLSNTIAHEILGQSVIYPAFQSVAKSLGIALTSWAIGEIKIAA